MDNSLNVKLNELREKFRVNVIKKHAENISLKYRNNDGSGKSLVNTKNEAVAYALSRMPATMAANDFVLNDFINLTGYAPKSVIDIGAGTGASSIIISELFPDTKLTLVEREENMLNIAKEFVQKAEFIKQDITNPLFDISKTYDLVITSYVLNELSENGREIALNNLSAISSDYLIIIDAGMPKNYNQMMDLREKLLSSGFNLVAPCPHEGKCPLIGTDDWCHFTARVNRTKLHKELKSGSLNYEDEKFTYLIFKKFNGTMNEYKRVIRHPKYRPKVVELKLCTKDGIKNLVITKSNKLYKDARDLKCGDRL